MDLIRELLLKLEQLSSAHRVVTFTADDEEIAVEGYTPDEIEYHLALIWREGFVETGTSGSGQMMSGEFLFRRLTWKGHDLIDSIRDPEVWKKTKEGASKAGGWTVQLLADFSKAILKQKLKEMTGFEL
ncbi:DUF2513 domain-containing protein [Microvirga sp. HBU67558]|uniref:DUF2513 domain-containing protein n=1 Tax=Microvirga sp. HBU67558 TaxID=2824562 RepID=UPI001B3756EE|nr:DUF2513 domain-containing protein [Microvirga sp. HBU67558]MBQ0820972.1 DUF2513 domain-containing protein [Microvirga sp. HBU67558]